MTPEALADMFFAAAPAVEAAGTVPISHLDLLAEHGYYGLYGPSGPPPAEAWRTVETIASGCLATAFVWVQHHGAVKAVSVAEREGRPAGAYREALCRGDLRAGTALGALRPGPPSVRAEAVAGGWRLSGYAPCVTGWGLTNALHIAARDPDDTIVWALLTDLAQLPATALELAAVNASRTVTLHLDDVFVPAEQVTGTMPYAEWSPHDVAGLRLNGSLALGLIRRCGLLLSDLDSGLAAELDAARSALDKATPDELPGARAGAAELAVRAAATVLTAAGARGILAGDPAQRLLREAGFLLVFGSRPPIRADLLRRLTRAAR